jgi:serine/threonine protein phosphatase PrpC
VTPSIILHCPSCGDPLLADDEFCETCGVSLAAERDTPRYHWEVDQGWAAGVSDRGLVHSRNEDALHVATVGGRAVVVVCDGVSASAGAQLAAQVAAEVAGNAIAAELDGPPAGGMSATVEQAMAAADDAVGRVPWLGADHGDAPACTIVAAVWDGDAVTVGWAGDSRAYWIGETESLRLTVDHSWAQQQVDAELLERAAAEADPRAHAITRWLGADAPASGQVAVHHPSGRGSIVVCSDGLWNYAGEVEELGPLVRSAPAVAPAEVARHLVRVALGRGGRDNVTVGVIEVDPGRVVEEA